MSQTFLSNSGEPFLPPQRPLVTTTEERLFPSLSPLPFVLHARTPRRPLQRRGLRYAKRGIDLLLSSLLILFVFPWFLPLMALLIKADSRGPVFFVQKRNKRGGGVFRCIKLRSMHVNGEADALPAKDGDERITRVGKFMRRRHLDEWPQLFNVWTGDMSLIGPRPHMLSDNCRFEALIPFYHHRHHTKPGMTGLAQVAGHTGPVNNPDDIQARVEKDLYYVYHWSIALDVRIALQTLLCLAGVNGKNALP